VCVCVCVVCVYDVGDDEAVIYIPKSTSKNPSLEYASLFLRCLGWSSSFSLC